MKYALSCIASAVLLLAAELPQAPAQTSVAFATIARGAHSAILDPTELAIRTASEWATLWRRHTLGIPEARTAPPAVDFFREMVVAVFAGQVPAGTHLTILKIFPQGNRLIVASQLRGPAGPEPVGVPPVTPFHIARLPRSPLPVVFITTKTPDLD